MVRLASWHGDPDAPSIISNRGVLVIPRGQEAGGIGHRVLEALREARKPLSGVELAERLGLTTPAGRRSLSSALRWLRDRRRVYREGPGYGKYVPAVVTR